MVRSFVFLLSACGMAAAFIADNSASRKTTVKNELNGANNWLATSVQSSKYDKMEVSQLTFYRGTSHLYFKDLTSKVNDSPFSSADTLTWIQGDAHLNNFGSFDNSHGDVVWGYNDFDEAYVASYLFDVWRLATSIELVGKENGISKSDRQDIIENHFAEFYLDTLESFRGNNDEATYTITESNAYGKLDDMLADVAGESREDMLAEWATSGNFDVSTCVDLEQVSTALNTEITTAIGDLHTTSSMSASYWTVKDVAKRLNAGIGSFGTPRYYVLIEGASSDDDDDRILDVKLQNAPAIRSYLTTAERSHTDANVGGYHETAVLGYKALAYRADDHLAWVTLENNGYSVRERSPFKKTLDYTELDTKARLEKLAEQWALAMAAEHARADKDWNAAFVSTSLEKEVHDLTDTKHSEFRTEVWVIAEEYADQVKFDYDFFGDLRDETSLP